MKGEVWIVRSNSSVAPKADWAKRRSAASARAMGAVRRPSVEPDDLARGQTTAIDVEAAPFSGWSTSYRGLRGSPSDWETKAKTITSIPGKPVRFVPRRLLHKHPNWSVFTKAFRGSLLQRPPEQPSDDGGRSLRGERSG